MCGNNDALWCKWLFRVMLQILPFIHHPVLTGGALLSQPPGTSHVHTVVRDERPLCRKVSTFYHLLPQVVMSGYCKSD